MLTCGEACTCVDGCCTQAVATDQHLVSKRPHTPYLNPPPHSLTTLPAAHMRKDGGLLLLQRVDICREPSIGELQELQGQNEGGKEVADSRYQGCHQPQQAQKPDMAGGKSLEATQTSMHSQSPGQMLTPTEEIPSQSRLRAPPAAKGSPCTCAAAHPPAPVASASPVSLTLGWRLVCREEKEKEGG